jgi:hypothetical protein
MLPMAAGKEIQLAVWHGGRSARLGTVRSLTPSLVLKALKRSE